ncbi:probable elongation factor 1-delta isoform X2 [Cataglyphis hispanica]|uniref:probable elongation factor 1-delta isoform X2 n=1 Tax=Cataglyphis hispanica TaxID=1086592 RepID=UPI0021805452|nr:probable elongation factor 1-delta isoform X2 [Cataglyphis hispanica]
MATATLVTAALAKEKVWFDKPSYDKAERLYFEKMAKVMSHKIAGTCMLKIDSSITDMYQDVINTKTLKFKAEKLKDNKLAVENELNMKRSTCQRRNIKANKQTVDVCNMQKKENIIKTSEKFDNTNDNAREKEIIFPNENSIRYNAKENKEKKNKEDTKNRNRGNKENDIGENKETAMAFTRTKEQYSDQMDDIAVLAHIANQDVTPRVVKLEKENQDLRNMIQDLKSSFEKLVQHAKSFETLEQRVESLEVRMPYLAICPAKPKELLDTEQESERNKHQKQNKDKDDDNDDVDLFASDSEGEDTEAAKIREERLAEYAAKKSKKPVLIAKSNIILDVKPWDDETNMKEMENAVRKIETDGLLWGASKLVPLAFGIHKLQISCVVEDDKVSVDWLVEQIQELEDYVQSVDIAAFNKV